MATDLRLESVSVEFEVLRHDDYNLKATLVNTLRRKRPLRQSIKALTDVTLTLREGDRLGVIGANGSGKTTLLRVVAGVLPPTTGRIYPARKTLNLLGDSGSGLNPEISGLENLRELALIQGMSWSEVSERLPEMEDIAGLGDRIRDPVYSYSAGMQTRLRLAVLFQQHPDVMVLDEGLGLADREFTQTNSDRFENLMNRTSILLVASHSETLIEHYCSRAVLLRGGTVESEGSVSSVLASYRSSI